MTTRRNTAAPLVSCAVRIAVAGAMMWSPLAQSAFRVYAASASQSTVEFWESLKELIEPASVGVPKTELARMNLLCADGLPGAATLDLPKSLSRLDEWARHVRSETGRHEYRFKRNAAEFDNSEGFFKMLMLAVVLAEDFHVHYSPSRRIDPSAVSVDDNFFADSRDVFLHGLLGPERRGTCSSLPVLYLAIGRRLGYPLNLVTTKGHLFVRWEGAGERFNIEAAGNGLNRFDDDYYRLWPFPITPEEERTEGYLKSLNSSEELAVFLFVRVQCLRAEKRCKEAIEAQEQVCRLMPASRIHRRLFEQLKQEIGEAAGGPRFSGVPSNQTSQTQIPK